MGGAIRSESGGFCEVAGAAADGGLDRDHIEAGLSEAAGWRSGYGESVGGGGAEMPISARIWA